MKILISTYACSPIWGSEPGVGWNWAVELAKQHDVVVLTHGHFRSHIEPFMARHPEIRLRFSYLDLEPVRGPFHEQLLNSHLYYVRWQRAAVRPVKALLARERFDLIHHLTFGTFRFPCFLGGLGTPLAMGPLGGGECAPMRLYRSLPWKVRLFELVRLVTLHMARLEPFTVLGLSRARVVLCKTEETRSVLPPWVRSRAHVCPEIGAPPPVPLSEVAAAPRPDGRLKLLFVGRLLGLKGITFAIEAVKMLRDEGISATLDIAGEGSLRPHLERLIAEAGLAEEVRLLGNLPRDQVMTLYQGADLFLFPSLHDSSGNVVLESLSRGLPVVCLDLGGPKYYVDQSCGVIIGTKGLTERTLAEAIALTLKALHRDPQRLRSMRSAALAKAGRRSWSDTVAEGYAHIRRSLEPER